MCRASAEHHQGPGALRERASGTMTQRGTALDPDSCGPYETLGVATPCAGVSPVERRINGDIQALERSCAALLTMWWPSSIRRTPSSLRSSCPRRPGIGRSGAAAQRGPRRRSAPGPGRRRARQAPSSSLAFDRPRTIEREPHEPSRRISGTIQISSRWSTQRYGGSRTPSSSGRVVAQGDAGCTPLPAIGIARRWISAADTASPTIWRMPASSTSSRPARIRRSSARR